MISRLSKSFGLIAALLLTICRAHGVTADRIAASLLPQPQALQVTGPDRALPAGALQVYLTGPAAPAWNWAAVMSGYPGRLSASSAEYLSGGTWTLAVVEEKMPRPQKAIEARAKIAARLGPQGYVLETNPAPGVIAIATSTDARGLLYSARTLAQLLAGGGLATVHIEDFPDIPTREVHIHGFDKGYGAGNLKSIASFHETLPPFLIAAAKARFTRFRLNMDAGWLTDGDRWVKGDIDATMRQVVADAHALGLDVLAEVRFSGQRAGSSEPDFVPMNPLVDWPSYAKAARRALSWGVDVLDFSCNDLGAINAPEVIARYGGDGRFSGKLMAQLLHQTEEIIAQEKPGTALYILPRFYGPIHWQRHPEVLSELWAAAPKGVVMSAAGIFEPAAEAVRKDQGAQFQLWVNYSSNHMKELRVILAGPTAPDVERVRHELPPAERRVLINLGYPVQPQASVALATGEWLWNGRAYDMFGSLRKAADAVWGDQAGLFMQYARLLDWDTITGSLALRAAALFTGPAPTAAVIQQWHDFHERAVAALELARRLRDEGSKRELKVAADNLYWNAKRVQLDTEAGLLLLVGKQQGSVDRAAIEKLLVEEERILGTNYPVEKNDPKSAEVSTRGIRAIRKALGGPAAPAAKVNEALDH